mmetsp:Transcript_26007/g.44188  ORF Transcript_26007/g.44188 Transcript_26007/m.44188 type:complete len:269 (+) Transcript_26007:506-1312(+)
MTKPLKPASSTTTLLPPPRTKIFRSCSCAQAKPVASSERSLTDKKNFAFPPTRSVVRSDKGSSHRTRIPDGKIVARLISAPNRRNFSTIFAYPRSKKCKSCTIVSPFATSPATTRLAAQRRSVEPTVLPRRSDGPSISIVVASPFSLKYLDGSRSLSILDILMDPPSFWICEICPVRPRKINSWISEVPAACVQHTDSNACKSVGNPGNGSVRIESGFISPKRRKRMEFFATLISQPMASSTFNTSPRSDGMTPSTTTSPPVAAAANK